MQFCLSQRACAIRYRRNTNTPIKTSGEIIFSSGSFMVGLLFFCLRPVAGTVAYQARVYTTLAADVTRRKSKPDMGEPEEENMPVAYFPGERADRAVAVGANRIGVQ